MCFLLFCGLTVSFYHWAIFHSKAIVCIVIPLSEKTFTASSFGKWGKSCHEHSYGWKYWIHLCQCLHWWVTRCHAGSFQGSDTTLCVVTMHTWHLAFFKAHRMYRAKNEPHRRLWTRADDVNSVLVLCTVLKRIQRRRMWTSVPPAQVSGKFKTTPKNIIDSL